LRIRFTPEGAEALVADALENAQSVRDLCTARFKDLHFALKLIVQNSGPQEFLLDAEAVREPDKVLSRWVVASYRPASDPAAGA
jgi:hypothetical protein